MDLINILQQHDPLEDVRKRADRAHLEVMLTVIANEIESLCGKHYADDA